MDNTLITYALIKSIYEERKDYLDVFVPFLLVCFPEEQQECSKDVLSKNLEKQSGLKVPEYTLNTIITRAVRTNYLTQKERECFLTAKGENFISETLSKQHETQREINALIEDVRTFIKDKYQFDLDSERILDTLNLFIKKYQVPLINFFNPKIPEEIKQSNLTKEDIYLIEYIKLAKKQKPESFNTLGKIFYGALISTVLNKENITEVNKEFGKVEIFFDTNFMFSIMDLHYPYICMPAKQLFDLFKKYKFQLKIFDFTIDEMVRVLKGYLKEKDKYFPNIKTDSIYSNLKNKGWTNEDCIRFISKIEQKIYDIAVKIEYTNKDLDRLKIDDERYYRISQYKPEKSLQGQTHDIYAIEKIREIRKKRPQREIENCVALFLTSDLKLSRFDFMEMGHNENSTIPEVISDKFLTTLLWLKNPEFVREMPLEMILSAQSELLISREVWNRFYQILVRLEIEGKVSEEDISSLIYYHQLESDLVTIEPNEITPEFTMKEIEESKKKINEETRKKLEEQRKIFEEQIAQKEMGKDQEWIRKLEEIKNNLRQITDKRSEKCISWITWGFMSLLLLFGLILILILGNTFFVLIGALSFITGILQFLGIQLNVKNSKQKLKTCLFNKLYEKKLRELKLQEIEK
jgi:hypothetical protein